MNEETSFLYRGTSLGFLGGETSKTQGITCTTTDPFVATLFAIECRNYGHGVILMAARQRYEGHITSSNWFALEEAAVNLAIRPSEFEKAVDKILEVDEAIRILGELGFEKLPTRLKDPTDLGETLAETSDDGLRLSPDQISYFNRRALGG